MSPLSHQAAQSPIIADLLAFLAGRTATLLSGMQRRRQRAEDLSLFSGLSETQLKDVGIDRWALCPARPVIEVKAGLMGRLMSMT